MSDAEDIANLFTDSESDEDFEVPDDLAIDDELISQSRTRTREPNRGPGRPRGRRGQQRERDLDPEVSSLINHAQQAFSTGEHNTAIQLVEEAIALDGSARIAYNLLTAIYDDIGDAHKALLAKVMAAHLNKQAKDDWIEIGERSTELGLLRQAALFFQHANRIVRDDWVLILRRAHIHEQLNEWSRALALLNRLRRKFWDKLDAEVKTQVYLIMARILKQLGRVEEATNMYLEIYQKTLESTSPDVPLNWQNLNVLAELLFDQAEYDRVIHITKTGSRFLLGMPEYGDAPDTEFDNYPLPIDIRIWLLVSRLKIWRAQQKDSDLRDALRHLTILLNCQPVADYADLYARAAASFFQAHRYEEALTLYDALSEIPLESLTEYHTYLDQAAKCHTQLGRIGHAEALYNQILHGNPDQLDALIGIGEIYQATNRPASARNALERVAAIRSGQVPAAQPRMEEVDEVFVPDTATPAVRPPTYRPSKAERQKQEREAQKRAETMFETLDRFETGLDAGNIVATNEWIRVALELFEMFCSTRKLFTQRNEEEAADESPSDAVFRGVSLETWFNTFLRLSLVQSKLGRLTESIDILKTLRQASYAVFKEATLDLVQLACAHVCKDANLISNTLRHMWSRNQFSHTVLLLYQVCLASGKDAEEVFGSSNNQKFFLRQIKAVDSAVYKKRIEGAARVSDSASELTKEFPLLHAMYANIMLLGPSYTPALTYLMRAYQYIPKDPAIPLTIAVVHLQRAIQRVSTNRQLQILEALSFMQEYFALRNTTPEEKQEALYNMGRFLHGIGLMTQAADFYEQALKYHKEVPPMYDLSCEAAYNLHLIWAISGNMNLSRQVLSEYLEV